MGKRGLIPAHAGKTFFGRRSGLAWPAHPRSRGENLEKLGGSFETLGSSPLTRGKHLAAWIAGVTPGLIPAHAGKTATYEGVLAAARAHPRSRGENTVEMPCQIVSQGSSPLTRGKHGQFNAAGWPAGLIPTHAGKTGERAHLPRGCGAHPHSRGEN